MITLCQTYEAAKAENEYCFLTVTACNKLHNLIASDHSIHLIQEALRENASVVQSTYQELNLTPWLPLFL
jgi:hypothetical protein